jgi:hypothetical protein
MLFWDLAPSGDFWEAGFHFVPDGPAIVARRFIAGLAIGGNTYRGMSVSARGRLARGGSCASRKSKEVCDWRGTLIRRHAHPPIPVPPTPHRSGPGDKYGSRVRCDSCRCAHRFGDFSTKERVGPFGTVPSRDAFPGTLCLATIVLSLRDKIHK